MVNLGSRNITGLKFLFWLPKPCAAIFMCFKTFTHCLLAPVNIVCEVTITKAQIARNVSVL